LGIDIGSVFEKNTDVVKVLVPEFVSRDRLETKLPEFGPSLFSENDLVEIHDLRIISASF
jgi:hypothetical protein